MSLIECRHQNVIALFKSYSTLLNSFDSTVVLHQPELEHKIIGFYLPFSIMQVALAQQN
jgi:hypothetical protein